VSTWFIQIAVLVLLTAIAFGLYAIRDAIDRQSEQQAEQWEADSWEHSLADLEADSKTEHHTPPES